MGGKRCRELTICATDVELSHQKHGSLGGRSGPPAGAPHQAPPLCATPIALGMRAFISSLNYIRLSKCWTLGSANLPCRSQSFRAGPALLWHRIQLSTRQHSRLPHRHSHHTSLSLEESTIYALSTAPGKAAIAVIRVSGPACRTVLLHIVSRQPQSDSHRYTTDCVPRLPSRSPGMRRFANYIALVYLPRPRRCSTLVRSSCIFLRRIL